MTGSFEATTGLKPYPAYKDSGVPWLGNVPEHWKIVPGRSCYTEKKVRNIGLIEKQILSLSFGRIVIKPEDGLHGLVPESFETYQVIEPNDIVVRPTDLQNDRHSLRFGISRHRGIITSAYLCIVTTDALTRDYGYLLLDSYDHKKVFYGLGSGLRQNLDWSDFKYLPCVQPPLPEQAAIVRYLTHIDQKIRQYIRAKQRLINLLVEQKQAIIHQTVTMGLDPTVRLISLGSAPDFQVNSRWPAYRLRQISELRTEKSRPDLGLLSVFLGRGVIPYDEGGGQVHKPSLSLANYQVVYRGDLVLNNQQAWRGSVGVSSYHGIISPAYVVLSLAKGMDSRYSDYLFQSRVMVSQYVTASKGVGDIQRDIYFPWLMNTMVPIPPVEEQIGARSYLDEKLSKINRQLEADTKAISLLREFRSRLMADVTTGRLDVHSVAAGDLMQPVSEELVDELEPIGLPDEANEAIDPDAAPEEVDE